MIAVLGAGSWGTALAAVLANNGHKVCIWGRDTDTLHEIINSNSNHKYLKELNNKPLFDNLDKIRVTNQLEDAIDSSTQYIILAIPSSVFPQIIHSLKKIFADKNLNNIVLVCATKGLASQSSSSVLPQWLNDIAASILGQHYPYCLLSGPSFAIEVAQKQPTAVVMASADLNLAANAAKIFHNHWFRVYSNEDILGVQLGGALKNILAFAVGCSDGVGFGSNARAALITRGLNEMLVLGKALGVKQTTLMGLSGLGDLVLSATDNQSRNKRFGYYIGQGLDKTQALINIAQNVESIETTKLIYNLAQNNNLELPITEQVYNILYNNLSVQAGFANLAARPQKSE